MHHIVIIQSLLKDLVQIWCQDYFNKSLCSNIAYRMAAHFHSLLPLITVSSKHATKP